MNRVHCQYCNKYKGTFSVNNRIESVHKRYGKFLIGGYGAICDNEGHVNYYGLWRIVCKHLENFRGFFCNDCARDLISKGKIILETISQTCYKCESKFKDYNDIKNRLVVHNKYNKWYYADEYDNNVRYNVDPEDLKLLRFCEKKLVEQWSRDQRIWYDTQSNTTLSPIWICKKCVKNNMRYKTITKCLDKFSNDLCTIIYDYDPDILILS